MLFVMCSGSHRWAVGFGLSPVQGHVSDMCSGPSGLSLELCGSQSAVEPHAGGQQTAGWWFMNDWYMIDSVVSPSGTWTLCRLSSQWSCGCHRNTLRKVSMAFSVTCHVLFGHLALHLLWTEMDNNCTIKSHFLLDGEDLILHSPDNS